LRYWRENRLRQNQIKDHLPETTQNPTGSGMRLTINQPIEEIGPPHSHDPSEYGYIPKGPIQGNPLAQISWRSLVVLGVSGGLIPCPDAIAILLIAVTINRIVFGLSLIVSFSLGLAVILIIIGVLIVQGKRLFSRLQWLNRVAYVVPIVSALVVLVMGTLLTVSAIRNISGSDPEIETTSSIVGSPQFDLQHTSVIFSSVDQQDFDQLFVIPAAGGQAKQITKEEKGILDYAVSQDHSKIIYATPDTMYGTQLWELTLSTSTRRLLLECPDALCSNVVWSPDENGVLYNRQEMDAETMALGIPSIWWFDFTTHATTPLFQDAQMPGFSPRWSPDGKWLSYTSFNPQEMQIYHMENGERRSISTKTRSPAAWSPEGDSILLTDIETIEESFIFKVFHYNLANQQVSQLDVDQTIDENLPSWSPDGQWIAVVRREWKSEGLARENQIWLIRPDGSEAHPVTQDHGVFHNQPIWSPDGSYLLYDVISASLSDPISSVHLLEIETGAIIEIAQPGNRPSWLLKHQ
jgi:Tol biopolymer transport system component